MKKEEASKRQPSTPRGKGGCVCPYCDEEIRVVMAPFCQSCGVALSYCTHCQVALEASAAECPKCGGPVEKRGPPAR